MTTYEERVAAADWAAEVDDYGCALLPRLLTPAELPNRTRTHAHDPENNHAAPTKEAA